MVSFPGSTSHCSSFRKLWGLDPDVKRSDGNITQPKTSHFGNGIWGFPDETGKLFDLIPHPTSLDSDPLQNRTPLDHEVDQIANVTYAHIKEQGTLYMATKRGNHKICGGCDFPRSGRTAYLHAHSF